MGCTFLEIFTDRANAIGTTIALLMRQQGLVASPKYLLFRACYLPSQPSRTGHGALVVCESHLRPVPASLFFRGVCNICQQQSKATSIEFHRLLPVLVELVQKRFSLFECLHGALHLLAVAIEVR